MTPKRSPASPSEPSPTPLFDFAADSPESPPPSAPTQAPKRGRRPKATQETEPTPAPKRSRTAKKSPSRPTKKAAADATPQELPPNERPFAIPENWLWTRLGDIIELISGRDASLDECNSEQNGIPYILGASNISQLNTFNAERWIEKPQVVSLKGDVLLSVKGTIGKLYIQREEMINISRQIMAIRVKTFIKNIVIYYFLASEVDKLKEAGNGLIPGISRKDILAKPFPLPPLAEQERIVALVERLFARLDEAAEIVRDALDGSEKRRSALLRSAFSGALTAQWREKHGVGLETWRQTKFSDLCEVVRGGSPRPAGDPTYYDGDIPFMKVADITRNEGPYVYEAQYSIKEAGLKKTRMVEANTLLLTNSGATLGVPAICAFRTTFNDGIAAFLNLPSENLLFYYYFWTSKTAELRAINKGVAQPNLNTDIIGATPINLPPVAEQAEIVRLLDAAFEKERRVCELAEETAARIETLKKAILARAFRGELGTNDPTDPKPFAPAPTT